MRGKRLPQSFFVGNRKSLLQKMDKDSLALLQSSDKMVRNADLQHPYRQDSNFFYFTGIEVPGCSLLLIPDNKGLPEEILFIPPIDPEMEKWEGKMLTVEDAQEISGIKAVYLDPSLEVTLFRAQHWRSRLYCELNPAFVDQPLTKQHLFLENLRTRIPGLHFEKLHPLATSLRSRKQPEEIELLNQSIKIADKALREVMAQLKPGMMEYQVEAILTNRYLMEGCDRLGYEIIAAGGNNACYLHYVDNDCELNDGELILIDTGGEFGMYSCDITRVYPVGGRFSERQSHCYQAVLEVNKRFIEEIRPGQTWRELFQLADEILGETYQKYGLIKDPKEHKSVSYHRIGHSLGLDIHDVSNMDEPLGPGAVITVEPGLYLPDEGIGIRIEDNVLFTENGTENLSQSIPKEIEEIEDLVGER